MCKMQTVIEHLSDLASSLCEVLNRLVQGDDVSIPNIDLHIRSLPDTNLDKQGRQKLHKQAVQLWNAYKTFKASKIGQHKEGLTRVGAFSSMLLARISDVRNRKAARHAELLNAYLMCVRQCLREEDLATALLLLEDAQTSCHSCLEKQEYDTHTSEQESACIIKYKCLYMLYGWKSSREDLATFWQRQVTERSMMWTLEDAEQVADVFYVFGTDCLDRGRYNDAATWLKRARACIDLHHLSSQFERSDLKLNIMHAFIRAHSMQNKGKFDAHTQGLAAALQDEYGMRLSITLLKLEILFDSVPFELDTAVHEMEMLITAVPLIKANHEIIRHCLFKLRSLDPESARGLLHKYISLRLVSSGQIDWIQTSIVTYIWMHTNAAECLPAMIHQLEQDLTEFKTALEMPLARDAAQAVHLLIWQAVEKSRIQEQDSLAILWCNIGRHNLLSSSGDSNLGRIERKLVWLHLQASDIDVAQRIWNEMSISNQNDRVSRFLSYCLALRRHDDAEVQACVNAMANISDDADELLLACAGEAAKSGNTFEAARALQWYFDEYQRQGIDPPLGAYPTLKRIVALLCDALDKLPEHETPGEEILIRFCAVFVSTIKSLQAMKDANRTPHASDWAWFRDVSRRYAMMHLASWPRRHIIDLLEYSTRIHQFLRSNVVWKQDLDVNYLQHCLYISEARRSDSTYTVENLPRTSYKSRSKPRTSECRLTLYNRAYEIYAETLESITELGSRGCLEDSMMCDILRAVCPFALEALLYVTISASGLDNFEDLTHEPILRFLDATTKYCPPAGTYAVLTNVILTFTMADKGGYDGLRMSGTSAAQLLGKIVKIIRMDGNYSLETAARWIRCIVQLVIEHMESILMSSKSPDHPRFSARINGVLQMLENITSQVVLLAGSRAADKNIIITDIDSPTVDMYPREELEWLGTKIFNLSMDLYAHHHDDFAKTWSRRALEIAELVGKDSNVLAMTIESRIKELDW